MAHADEGTQVVFQVAGRDITRDEANRAFSLVQNPEHWKGAIVCRRSAQMVDDVGGVEVIVTAVIFYTGSMCTVTPLADGSFHFSAEGYWAAVGA